ncbi:CHAT domain-containing protein [Pantanalinema sp. GBBB05]|uniref:CHAT domain-containing protein n=1 Tax=Pantanalinema sp. GBBB05 TaxID=2604139 RepID=UPI003D8154DE
MTRLAWSEAAPSHLIQQGEQQLQQGQPNLALTTWQQAEQEYRQMGDAEGMVGSQINQARALQSLGFYRRAKTLLEQVEMTLQQQPDSSLKLTGLFNLGNVLRLVGDLEASGTVLRQAYTIAQSLPSIPAQQTAAFHLANTLVAQQQPEAALKLYQQAALAQSPVQFPASLNQLNQLIALKRYAEVQALLPAIEPQLAALPAGQMAIYGQISLAESLLKLVAERGSQTDHERTMMAQWLVNALQQARTLGDRRAESYALGRLGAVYESNHQWVEAERLTTQAWLMAQSKLALDLAYQWRWQLGRLRTVQGDRAGAITHYTQAVQNLQVLRNDLGLTHPEVQFSFREQVEPVYRELVDLLLQEPLASPEQLQQARQVIESLQIAELTNFFRAACLDAQPRAIDQIDPTAAVIYPIILRDRLEVILSIPGHPLRHYTTHLPQAEIRAGIRRMQQSMRVTAFLPERLAAAQEIDRWLVQPAVPDLNLNQIKTLVFVLDGGFRNLPMAALHDGNQYLIERYRVAITPGLQLFNPQPLSRQKLQVLVGGLSQGTQDYTALPGVEQEVYQISHQLPTTVLMNQAFTTQALAAKLRTMPFPVVHLATHGQFSSKASDTYIRTWDGKVQVNDLQALLQQREGADLAALELLILSACQTAQGDDRAALGMAGVAVRSGARSTLASLWTVNDTSTALLITQFYQALTQPDMTRAEAVQQAQLALLHHPKFQHPYFWAPFILVGNWL